MTLLPHWTISPRVDQFLDDFNYSVQGHGCVQLYALLDLRGSIPDSKLSFAARPGKQSDSERWSSSPSSQPERTI